MSLVLWVFTTTTSIAIRNAKSAMQGTHQCRARHHANRLRAVKAQHCPSQVRSAPAALVISVLTCVTLGTVQAAPTSAMPTGCSAVELAYPILAQKAYSLKTRRRSAAAQQAKGARSHAGVDIAHKGRTCANPTAFSLAANVLNVRTVGQDRVSGARSVATEKNLIRPDARAKLVQQVRQAREEYVNLATKDQRPQKIDSAVNNVLL